MVKVNYYTKIIEFSQKTQKVMFLFKRLPTLEQLGAFDKQQLHPRQMVMSGWASVNFFQMFGELELNWDKVRVDVTKQQAHKANLKIGDVVQLDIPEEHSEKGKIDMAVFHVKERPAK